MSVKTIARKFSEKSFNKMPKFVSSNGCEAGENVFIWHIITSATESTIRCVEVRAEGAALCTADNNEIWGYFANGSRTAKQI